MLKLLLLLLLLLQCALLLPVLRFQSLLLLSVLLLLLFLLLLERPSIVLVRSYGYVRSSSIELPRCFSRKAAAAMPRHGP